MSTVSEEPSVVSLSRTLGLPFAGGRGQESAGLGQQTSLILPSEWIHWSRDRDYPCPKTSLEHWSTSLPLGRYPVHHAVSSTMVTVGMAMLRVNEHSVNNAINGAEGGTVYYFLIYVVVLREMITANFKVNCMRSVSMEIYTVWNVILKNFPKGLFKENITELN